MLTAVCSQNIENRNVLFLCWERSNGPESWKLNGPQSEPSRDIGHRFRSDPWSSRQADECFKPDPPVLTHSHRKKSQYIKKVAFIEGCFSYLQMIKWIIFKFDDLDFKKHEAPKASFTYSRKRKTRGRVGDWIWVIGQRGDTEGERAQGNANLTQHFKKEAWCRHD